MRTEVGIVSFVWYKSYNKSRNQPIIVSPSQSDGPIVFEDPLGGNVNLQPGTNSNGVVPSVVLTAPGGRHEDPPGHDGTFEQGIPYNLDASMSPEGRKEFGV